MNQSPPKKSSLLVWLGVVAAASLLTAVGAMLVVHSAPVGPHRGAFGDNSGWSFGRAGGAGVAGGPRHDPPGGITVQAPNPHDGIRPRAGSDSGRSASDRSVRGGIRGAIRSGRRAARADRREFQGGAVLVRKGDLPLVSNYSKSTGKVVLSDSMIWAPHLWRHVQVHVRRRYAAECGRYGSRNSHWCRCRCRATEAAGWTRTRPAAVRW